MLRGWCWFWGGGCRCGVVAIAVGLDRCILAAGDAAGCVDVVAAAVAVDGGGNLLVVSKNLHLHTWLAGLDRTVAFEIAGRSIGLFVRSAGAGGGHRRDIVIVDGGHLHSSNLQ